MKWIEEDGGERTGRTRKRSGSVKGWDWPERENRRKKKIEMDKEWIADVRRELYLRGESLKDLAENIGMSYSYIRQIMTGKVESLNAEEKISEYLKTTIT